MRPDIRSCPKNEGEIMDSRILRLIGIACLVSVLAAFGIGVSGCSSIAEQAVEEIVEESTGIEVDEDGEQVTITGEDGETLEIGGGTTLPDDFPSDVPVYDGEIVSSTSFSAGEGQSYSVGIMADDAFADVVDWYKAEFLSEAWEVVGETTADVDGSSTAILAYRKGEMEAGITVIEDSESPEVNIVQTVTQP